MTLEAHFDPLDYLPKFPVDIRAEIEILKWEIKKLEAETTTDLLTVQQKQMKISAKLDMLAVLKEYKKAIDRMPANILDDRSPGVFFSLLKCKWRLQFLQLYELQLIEQSRTMDQGTDVFDAMLKKVKESYYGLEADLHLIASEVEDVELNSLRNWNERQFADILKFYSPKERKHLRKHFNRASTLFRLKDLDDAVAAYHQKKARKKEEKRINRLFERGNR